MLALVSIPLDRLDAAAAARPVQPHDAGLREALLAGERLHRELRPDLARAYLAQLRPLFDEGTRLTQLVEGGEVRALALWRVFHTTCCGRRLEVDDLVTAAAATRLRGYGATLLDALEAKARALGCPTITLNSATRRGRAHRFYFRRGYTVLGFQFSKDRAPHRSLTAV